MAVPPEELRRVLGTVTVIGSFKGALGVPLWAPLRDLQEFLYGFLKKTFMGSFKGSIGHCKVPVRDLYGFLQGVPLKILLRDLKGYYLGHIFPKSFYFDPVGLELPKPTFFLGFRI